MNLNGPYTNYNNNHQVVIHNPNRETLSKNNYGYSLQGHNFYSSSPPPIHEYQSKKQQTAYFGPQRTQSSLKQFDPMSPTQKTNYFNHRMENRGTKYPLNMVNRHQIYNASKQQGSKLQGYQMPIRKEKEFKGGCCQWFNKVQYAAEDQ